MYYAHTGTRPDRSDWQRLRDHLAKVSELAEAFARGACPHNVLILNEKKEKPSWDDNPQLGYSQHVTRLNFNPRARYARKTRFASIDRMSLE
jgi:hypothetical protein